MPISRGMVFFLCLPLSLSARHRRAYHIPAICRPSPLPYSPFPRALRAYLPPHGISPRRDPPRALARISATTRTVAHGALYLGLC